jgi:hypothetical protein
LLVGLIPMQALPDTFERMSENRVGRANATATLPGQAFCSGRACPGRENLTPYATPSKALPSIGRASATATDLRPVGRANATATHPGAPLLVAAIAASAVAACSPGVPPPDNAAALAAIAARQAGTEIEVEGKVLRVLPTVWGPSGLHERFILRVTDGRTSLPLFVADNVSIAAAAPLHRGDDVIVRGELDFNDLGPVLHWTHRDPRLRHPLGFVEVGGKVYE